MDQKIRLDIQTQMDEDEDALIRHTNKMRKVKKAQNFRARRVINRDIRCEGDSCCLSVWLYVSLADWLGAASDCVSYRLIFSKPHYIPELFIHLFIHPCMHAFIPPSLHPQSSPL
jgi:hypothetical protein